MEMKKLKVRLTLIEELLGTASGNRKVHTDYIASKVPGVPNRGARIRRRSPPSGRMRCWRRA